MRWFSIFLFVAVFGSTHLCVFGQENAALPEPGADVVFSEAPAHPASTLDWGGDFRLQSGALLGPNMGLMAGAYLRYKQHAWGFDGFVGGGSFLRTGGAVRYRLNFSKSLHWWTAVAVVFDILPIHDDLLVWSRWTAWSTGLEFDIKRWLVFGVDFSFLLRVAPLGLTRVKREQGRSYDVEHDYTTIVDDLRHGLFHPGVYIGLRL